MKITIDHVKKFLARLGFRWNEEYFNKTTKTFERATNFRSLVSQYPMLTQLKFSKNKKSVIKFFSIDETHFEMFEETLAQDGRSIHITLDRNFSKDWQSFLKEKEKHLLRDPWKITCKQCHDFAANIKDFVPTGFTYRASQTRVTNAHHDNPLTATLCFRRDEETYMDIVLDQDSCTCTIYRDGRKPVQYFSDQIQAEWNKMKTSNASSCIDELIKF